MSSMFDKNMKKAQKKRGEPCPIELEYPRRGLLPSEGYYQYFISYKLYPRPQ